jgi:hypothetical protein
LQRHIAVIFELNAAPSSGHFVNFATLFSGLLLVISSQRLQNENIHKTGGFAILCLEKIIAKDLKDLEK